MQWRACRSLQSVGMETLGISLRVVEVEKPRHMATCSSLIQRLHKLRQREKSQSLMDWHMSVIKGTWSSLRSPWIPGTGRQQRKDRGYWKLRSLGQIELHLKNWRQKSLVLQGLWEYYGVLVSSLNPRVGHVLYEAGKALAILNNWLVGKLDEVQKHARGEDRMTKETEAFIWVTQGQRDKICVELGL